MADIAAWTVRQFGRNRAEAYRDALLDRIARLAAGALPRARSCAALFRGEPDEQAFARLLYYREGGHYLILEETATELVVVDILHGRMDLPGHPKALGSDSDRPEDENGA